MVAGICASYVSLPDVRSRVTPLWPSRSRSTDNLGVAAEDPNGFSFTLKVVFKEMGCSHYSTSNLGVPRGIHSEGFAGFEKRRHRTRLPVSVLYYVEAVFVYNLNGLFLSYVNRRHLYNSLLYRNFPRNQRGSRWCSVREIQTNWNSVQNQGQTLYYSETALDQIWELSATQKFRETKYRIIEFRISINGWWRKVENRLISHSSTQSCSLCEMVTGTLQGEVT